MWVEEMRTIPLVLQKNVNWKRKIEKAGQRELKTQRNPKFTIKKKFGTMIQEKKLEFDGL